MSSSDELAKIIGDHKNLNVLSVLTNILSEWDTNGVPDSVTYMDGKLYYGNVCIAHVAIKKKSKDSDPEWYTQLSHRVKANYPHTQAIYLVPTTNLKNVITLDGGYDVDVYILERPPKSVKGSFYEATTQMTPDHIYTVLGFMVQSQIISDTISLAGGIGSNLILNPQYVSFEGTIGSIKIFGCAPYITNIYDIVKNSKTSRYDIFNNIANRIPVGPIKETVSTAQRMYTASTSELTHRYFEMAPVLLADKQPIDICDGGSCRTKHDLFSRLSYMIEKKKILINQDIVSKMVSSNDLPDGVADLAGQAITSPSVELLTQLTHHINGIHQEIRHRATTINDTCPINESDFHPDVVGDHNVMVNVRYDSLMYSIANSINGVGVGGVMFVATREIQGNIYYISDDNTPYSVEDIEVRLNSTPYTTRSVSGDMLSNYDRNSNTVYVKGSNYSTERKSVNDVKIYDPCQIGVYTRYNLELLQMYTVIKSYLESVIY